jgi:hypothetical protein
MDGDETLPIQSLYKLDSLDTKLGNINHLVSISKFLILASKSGIAQFDLKTRTFEHIYQGAEVFQCVNFGQNQMVCLCK